MIQLFCLFRAKCALPALATLIMASTAAMADGSMPLNEQYAMLQISEVMQSNQPVTKIVIGTVNIRLGVHLERMTLLSGEGHAGEKLASGLLAGAASLMGAGAGDYAMREPINDHFPEADAKKIADDIAKMLSDVIVKNGLEIVDPQDVVKVPAFATLKGQDKNTTEVENIKGGLFKPSFYFVYHRIPVLGYKYRERGMFEGVTDDYSRAIRDATGVPISFSLTVSIVNDRKLMRVRELTLQCLGKTQGYMSNSDNILATISVMPDEINVPTGESHKNLDYWAALSPKFEMAVKTMVGHLVEKLPSKQNKSETETK